MEKKSANEKHLEKRLQSWSLSQMTIADYPKTENMISLPDEDMVWDGFLSQVSQSESILRKLESLTFQGFGKVTIPSIPLEVLCRLVRLLKNLKEIPFRSWLVKIETKSISAPGPPSDLGCHHK
jgi:hypothetical protein